MHVRGQRDQLERAAHCQWFAPHKIRRINQENMMIFQEEIDSAIEAIVEGVQQAISKSLTGGSIERQIEQLKALPFEDEVSKFLQSRQIGPTENYWHYIDLLRACVQGDETARKALPALLQIHLSDTLRWQIAKPAVVLNDLVGIIETSDRAANYYDVEINKNEAVRDALIEIDDATLLESLRLIADEQLMQSRKGYL